MGPICPCVRDQAFLKDASTISSGVEYTAPSPLSSPIRTVNIGLKSDAKIGNLTGPLSQFYREIKEVKSDFGFKVTLSENLGTQQMCLVHAIQKNRRRNRAKFKNDLFEKMHRLDHPHILKLHEMLQDTQYLYIVTEVYEGGSLSDVISREGCFSERTAATAMHEILSALAYAHSVGVTHKHVSPSTVVVKTDPELETINVKLAGFEFAEFADEPKAKTAAVFTAPEWSEIDTTEKVDIWSCGAVLVYMLTGHYFVPQGGSSSHLAQFPSNIWSSLSPHAITLVASMLNPQSESRPTALECIAHRWIQEFACIHGVTSKPVRRSLMRLRESEPCESLKGALVRFMLFHIIGDSEISKLSESFRALDKNGDGLISEDELLFSLKKVMPEDKAAEEAKRVMANIDQNHSGMIDYSEFLLSTFSQERILSTANLKTAFRSLDVDGSGTISIQELKLFFVLNSTKDIDFEWEKLMAKYDITINQELDFKKFQVMMLSVLSG